MTASRRFITPFLHVLSSIGVLLVTLTGYAHSATAAERLTLHLGLLQQTIDISELEVFAKTGELSPRLEPYRMLFTPTLQGMLQKHLHVDPLIAAQFLEDLFRSADGKNLLKQLNSVIPESTPQQLKTTLNLVLKESRDISVLNFLKAYPGKSLTLNLTAMLGMAAQLNTTALQSQVLSPRLIDDLSVEEKSSLSTNFSPDQTGNKLVFKNTKIFKDQSRNRKILVDIYYTYKAHGPLVVMSHGFAADRRFLQYLAYHLASHGLTVVSVEHSGSNIDSLVQISAGIKLSKILPASEFVDRPKDISFVLDQLAKLNQKPGYWHSKFNTEQVTIIGHSFGGYTALALAGGELNLQAIRQFCQNLNTLGRSPADWLQCAAAELPYKTIRVRDRRIVQRSLFNPIIGNLFNQNLSSVKIPTLILASTEGWYYAYSNSSITTFSTTQKRKYLLVAAGATHMSVTDISYLSSTMGQSTLVREVMDENAEPVRQLARGMSLAFIKQLTPQAQTYQPYLTSTYVQSLSSSQISLRMTKKLPDSVEAWIKILSFGQPKMRLNSLPTKPSWIEQVQECVANLEGLFYPHEYHTERLESVFSELLEHSNQELDRLS